MMTGSLPTTCPLTRTHHTLIYMPAQPDPPRHPRLGAAATPAPAPSTMARPGAWAPARRSPPSTPSAAQQPTAAARVPEAASGLGCVPTAAPSAVGVVRPLRVAATADELQRFASRDAARRVGTPAQSTPRFGQPLQGLGARVLHEGRRFGRRFIGGCARCFAPHDPLAAFNVPALDLSKAAVRCGEAGIGKRRSECRVRCWRCEV